MFRELMCDLGGKGASGGSLELLRGFVFFADCGVVIGCARERVVVRSFDLVFDVSCFLGDDGVTLIVGLVLVFGVGDEVDVVGRKIDCCVLICAGFVWCLVRGWARPVGFF